MRMDTMITPGRPSSARRTACLRCGLWLGCLSWFVMALGSDSLTNRTPVRERSFSYSNDVIPEMPWSIHVVKVTRADPALAFHTTIGKGEVFGMATVSEQLKSLDPELGRPLAAINGDFYENSENY